MNHKTGIENRHLASYLTLRKGIGYLGCALPFILGFGGMLLAAPGIRSSVSAYYHTGLGDVFVGTICVIGIFLFAYKGYEPRDDRAGDFACFCAIGLALFPTLPDMGDTSRGILLTVSPGTADILTYIKRAHFVFAAGFFLTLAYFSICLFTKSDREITPKKRQRNSVYKACGYVMLLALALIALEFSIQKLELLPEDTLSTIESLHPRFWLESIAMLAFGFSWLVKGKAILVDET